MPTEAASLPLPDYEEEILRSLQRIIRAVDLYSRKSIAKHGLSGPQLMCLRELERNGPVSTGALAKALSLSPATVCGILDRLEAKRFVLRQRQTDDKRKVLVRLSRTGRNAVRATPAPLQEGFVAGLRDLPARQQMEIHRVLKRLVAMLAAESLAAEPVPGSAPPPLPRRNVPREAAKSASSTAPKKGQSRRSRHS